MLRGVGVGKYLINLPRLQRDFVAFVLQANNKGFCRFHRGLGEIAFDPELFASNAMSFVPVLIH
jgi:hypothetical protein